MKKFEKDGKINFVDRKNVLVGFDMQSSCCEYFGWMITKKIPTECVENTCEVSEKVLESYFFDRRAKPIQSPNTDDGGTITFTLRAPKKRALYLTLFNHHSGYYAHGFEMSVGGLPVLTGSL